MRILGVSCDYHDSAAAIVVEGEIIAAAEEERFSRRKHDAGLPERAVASCLAIAGLEPDDVDAVVVYEKPLNLLTRLLASRQRIGPAALPHFTREMPVFLRSNLLVGYRLEKLLRRLGATRPPQVHYSEHHMSHAASAYFPSPFDSAAILTVDGVGEWATSVIGMGRGRVIDLLEEQRFPNSLGLLYSLATAWCGFTPNDGEYKLMGLAPYGEPSYRESLSELAELAPDGGLIIDGRRVRWWSARPERLGHLHAALGGPPRAPDDPITQRDVDLARSVQEFTEDAVLSMARHAHELTGSSLLCLSGGVALNCVANGRLLREGPFEDVWVQPAAGDAGSALGAALWYWHQVVGAPRSTAAGSVDSMNGSFLGPSFSPDAISEWLTAQHVSHERVGDRSDLCASIAAELANGSIVGWFEGRMEFGPRALGHRSILADPRSPTVQLDLNMRVKGRESFRPFAPAVLSERAAEWFEVDRPSPYMLFTFQVADEHSLDVDDDGVDPFERVQVVRSDIPGCTHVDWSARVQTVDARTNGRFHQLLRAFEDLTGCPVLLNTSFNIAGEPIVCTPEDALGCAVAANLDILVIEDCVLDLRSSDMSAGACVP